MTFKEQVSFVVIKINQILHFKCGKSYFEIEDKEIEKCPWCKSDLKEDDIVPDGDQIEKYIYAEPFTGELKVITEKKLDIILQN